ncbi:MBL fold metallo-hydrolase [Pseudomonas muyukensis]|uniref:MBL fold metallo-hydrolase n=1 Tax=Pseudomonas muyukensis TaxID=2842357 RepID=A0ABX8M3W3_9PSED|nr:MBL fold metallo-hydrolase [Pseudomonas muyukensis]QXH33708.1 MBL fold metallo-hydrolase [Pseudomonas muyukensis]
MHAAIGFALLFIWGCCPAAGPEAEPKVWTATTAAEPSIQYLGVGGWLMHWRGEGVMLAPSFSNPATLVEGVPPLWVKADKQRINTYMRRAPADDVTLLLVGHGHYDHLLDVPWVMHWYARNAQVYGSDTVVHMLRAFKDPDRVGRQNWIDPARVNSARGYMATVPGCAGRAPPARPGYWITSSGGHIRAMPIESMHASHLLGHTFAQGDYHTDLVTPPASVFGWKQGQSMAWLIDLLGEDGKPAYRIHYQDSAASAPCGILPTPPDATPVDVLVLSVGSWRHARHYPQRVLAATQPRVVLLGHWENFFGNTPEAPQPMKGQAVAQMQHKVEALARQQSPPATVYLPKPFARVPLPPR